MAEWIPIRTDLHEDPAVFGIACDLRLSPDAVVGKLLKLWSVAQRQSLDGRLSHCNAVWVDKTVGHKGFALSMTKVGWLELLPSGLFIPHFDYWMSESAKKRLSEARKKHQQRSRAPLPAPENVPKKEGHVLSLSSVISSPEERGSGETDRAAPTEREIDFWERIALVLAGPAWYLKWAVRHAGRFGLWRDNDPNVMADWWSIFAKCKVLEGELEDASAWILLQTKQPRGRSEHPRMLLARIQQRRKAPTPATSQPKPDQSDRENIRRLLKEGRQKIGLIHKGVIS